MNHLNEYNSMVCFLWSDSSYLPNDRCPPVVGTQGFLSPKSHGKRPSNAFVGMKVAGDLPKEKAYLTTSVVKCKNSDEPQWFDNLGP